MLRAHCRVLGIVETLPEDDDLLCLGFGFVKSSHSWRNTNFSLLLLRSGIGNTAFRRNAHFYGITCWK